MRSIGFPELITTLVVAVLYFLIPVVLILLGVRFIILRHASSVASKPAQAVASEYSIRGRSVPYANNRSGRELASPACARAAVSHSHGGKGDVPAHRPRLAARASCSSAGSRISRLTNCRYHHAIPARTSS